MQVLIVGGGASGMLCALHAAQRGHSVTIAEQNEKLGKKLYITGKGRCNFTNDCTQQEFLDHVVSNPRFLYSASGAYSPQDCIAEMEALGLKTKVERGRRAFPASDHSGDVIDALRGGLARAGVRVLLHTRIISIVKEGSRVTCAEAERDGKHMRIPFDHLVLATGGLSYPSTGSTGDGFRFAKEMGLRVTALMPSLVPMNCKEEYIREMQGLSLRNVEFTIRTGKKELFRDFGELMFTHFGITGPLVLSASAVCGPYIGKKELISRIDLKPAVTEEMLDQRLLRLIAAHPQKGLRNLISELYPAKMQPVIPEIARVDPDRKASEVTREERRRIVEVTKAFPLSITSLRGYNEAVITKGGISVKEVDPKTMRVKSYENLSVIGEMLDLDAMTGGYNLQIAWCTAAACAAGM